VGSGNKEYHLDGGVPMLLVGGVAGIVVLHVHVSLEPSCLACYFLGDANSVSTFLCFLLDETDVAA
jgi:hypothetical protein